MAFVGTLETSKPTGLTFRAFDSAERPRRRRNRDFNITKYRDFIVTQYVTHSKTVIAISEALKAQYGVHVTERKIKCLLRDEGWDKNIDYSTYFAMHEVAKVLPPLEFRVPRVGGTRNKTVVPKQLKKEIERKMKKELRSGTPDTFNAGLSKLIAQKVMARLCSSNDEFKPIMELVNMFDLDVEVDQAELETDEYDFLSDAETETSGSELDQLEHEPDQAHFGDRDLVDMNFTNVAPRFRATRSPNAPQTGDRQHDLVPAPAAFALDIARAVMPKPVSTHIQKAHGDVGIVVVDPSAPNDTWLNSSDPSAELAELLSTLTVSRNDADSWTQQKRQREKDATRFLKEHWDRFDYDGSWKLVIELAAYYLQQCWAGYSDLDPFDDVDRVEARHHFNRLIASNHGDVLVVIYWIGTVLAAHGKGSQMMSFYLDCWHCCERSNSLINRIITPILRFIMLQMQDSDQELVREILDDTHLRELDNIRASFDADTEFESASHLVEQMSQQPSRTGLILVLYRAWHLTGRGQHDESVDLMLTHLQKKTQAVMGEQHIVTIGYYSLMAKNYAEMSRPQMGHCKNYHQYIEFHLRNCPRAIEPLRFMAIEKLAEIARSEGDLQQAADGMQQVYQYRIQTFGVTSGFTWSAARALWSVWQSQGWVLEARTAEEDLTRRFQDADAHLRRQRR